MNMFPTTQHPYSTLLISNFSAQGLKVVAIDTRTEALELVRSLDNDHRPDLVIDASKSKADDALNAIHGLRPSGYRGWDGVDGKPVMIGG